MPVNPNALIEVTAFKWVPPFAEGLVRDLRVRWALEEIGLDYRVRLVGRPLPDGYVNEQPFEQVPCFSDGTVKIFESGAIVQYIGEKSEVLLPTDPQEHSGQSSGLTRRSTASNRRSSTSLPSPSSTRTRNGRNCGVRARRTSPE